MNVSRGMVGSWLGRFWALGAALMCLSTPAVAAAPTGARTVQLIYEAPPGDALYMEVAPRESASGTYFCAAGFEQGYFGLQELGSTNNRVLLFTLWDPASGKPKATNRIEAQYLHPQATSEVLTGDPVGLQATLPLPWVLNDTYRLLIQTTEVSNRLDYAAYLQDPSRTNQWLHFATLSAPAGRTPISGCYSFIEDFRRDTHSLTNRRWASFGRGWIRSRNEEGKPSWGPLNFARFEAEESPAENINAGTALFDGWFYLATGGTVTNTTTKLKTQIAVQALDRSAPDWLLKFDPKSPRAFSSLAIRPAPAAPLVVPDQPSEPPPVDASAETKTPDESVKSIETNEPIEPTKPAEKQPPPAP